MNRNKNQSDDDIRRQNRNEDPITEEPGAHPVGTGAGAVIGGALAGAAAGALAGPIGTVAGAVIGGVAGAAAGKAIAENVNPTVETDYWRQSYRNRPYYSDEYDFEDYEPAYRLGWENYSESNRDWNASEPELRRKWQENRWEDEGGSPPMSWEEARLAAKDAYERVANRGEADYDTDSGTSNKPR